MYKMIIFIFVLGNICIIYCGDGFYGDFVDWKCKLCSFNCCICVDGIYFDVCKSEGVMFYDVCISCYDDWYFNGIDCVGSCVEFYVG